jgi:hypothetical protein
MNGDRIFLLNQNRLIAIGTIPLTRPLEEGIEHRA